MIQADGSIADPYRNFIAVSRYARWIEEENRRESWGETVSRYINFMRDHLARNFVQPDPDLLNRIQAAIMNHQIMPSMRALMTAGPALERSHLAGYNCSFIAVDHPRAFDEAMYVLLNGTGVGFSVESRHVEKLPMVPRHIEYHSDAPIIVQDSKEGWAEAFRDLLGDLWRGRIPAWDLSQVRPAGSRLKTFGGRASGPEPLQRLFEFAVQLFTQAQARYLTPLECHDLMCYVGDVVVSGGVRRSALISLSDLSDDHMAEAKSGPWWEHAGHRRLANNSAVHTTKPTHAQFWAEWERMIASGSGERGIWNLAGTRQHALGKGRRSAHLIDGCNPCAEILLRNMQLCNLTEVVIRPEDSLQDVTEKVELAAVLGTWQSTLTNFRHVRPQWRENCEEERLLGVSLTGIYGHPAFNDHTDPHLPHHLANLRVAARLTNAEEARRLGINPSAAVTCIKPSGTVSQLTGVSSGIHPWHSEHYLRTVRGANTDPLTRMLKDHGVPNEPDVMSPEATTVFTFPVAAPAGAVTRNEITALEHLKLWAIYRQHWTDHNPSVTINVAEHEWQVVGQWVWEHWDEVGGISFLPKTEHVYEQAPYTDCDKSTYQHYANEMPHIDWGILNWYEREDTTTGTQELACSSGACEIVDLPSAAPDDMKTIPMLSALPQTLSA